MTDAAAVAPLPDLDALLVEGEDDVRVLNLRRAETIGRPVSDPAFMAALERVSGRTSRRAAAAEAAPEAVSATACAGPEHRPVRPASRSDDRRRGAPTAGKTGAQDRLRRGGKLHALTV